MIIDYRAYCTIYVLCVLAYAATLPLIQFRGGRYFYPFIGCTIFTAAITGTINFLDWLWS